MFSSSVPAAFVVFLANSWWTCGGLENNLAMTPPMGWTAWGRFRCNIDCQTFPKECVSEWLFRDMADRMVEDGYLQAGYEYVLIDDCWLATQRDSDGRLYPDPVRFPSGLKNLSDYIHSKGLKFGIYEDFGEKTCEGYPGILQPNMAIDAETFAQWDVDFVKLDGCYSEPLEMEAGYQEFGMELLKTGRPMVYACSWPTYQSNYGIQPNYSAVVEVCNVWRTFKDVQDSWNSVRSIMKYFAEHQEEFAPIAGPGHWNDPDMLVIGNFGLSYEQAKAQMAIWAILAAPLIMSHDMREVRPEFRDILLNPVVIDVNQDPLGIQGTRIYLNKTKKYEVWSKPVLPIRCNVYSWAFVVFNLDDNGEPSNIFFPMKYLKLQEDLTSYNFFDLFDLESDVQFNCNNELVARIPPLGVKMYKAELNRRGKRKQRKWKKYQYKFS